MSDALKDGFRTTFTGARLLLPNGVSALVPLDQAAVLNTVAEFMAFTSDNGPREEHDFRRH